MDERYRDIIDLPYPQHDPAHPRMAAENRAAQFSPFAALTGYDAVVEETARWTESKIELSEDAKAILDNQLQMLAEQDRPEVTVTYFVPDTRKSGGAYLTVQGVLKRIDAINRELVFLAENGVSDGKRVPIDDIWRFGGALAQALEDWG